MSEMDQKAREAADRWLEDTGNGAASLTCRTSLASAFKAFVGPVERERDEAQEKTARIVKQYDLMSSEHAALQEKLGRFQSVTSLTRQVRDAEKRAEAAEAELAKLRHETPALDLLGALDPEIQGLRAELAKAREERDEARRDFENEKRFRAEEVDGCTKIAGDLMAEQQIKFEDEIEALRAQLAEAKANAEGAEARGREAEREAVVGWLREHDERWMSAAAMIEAGAHRPTQEERGDDVSRRG